MVNKLAGQKMKFTKARTAYYRSDDEDMKRSAIGQMANVLEWARNTGISEAEVTQGYEFPEEVRHMSRPSDTPGDISDAEAESYEQELKTAIDSSHAQECGSGSQYVYAYGYRCAPGILKVGRSDKDVVARITSQINTSTPGKPILELLIRTNDCRGLEKALHGVLQVRGRKETGGGDEWFRTDAAEVLEIYNFCLPELLKARLAVV